MTETLIRTPADLRPGDIMLGPIGGAVGIGVGLGQLWLGEGFRIGKASIRHAAIVLDAGLADPPGSISLRMVEAMPSGARYWVGPAEERWSERYAYVRLPEDYPGQGEDAAVIARLMADERVPYSFASYLALGLHRWGLQPERLERWINRRRPPVEVRLRAPITAPRAGRWPVALPCEAICSVLVDQAWTLTGKSVMEDVRPQAVTPGRLAVQLLGKPGATWCFPFAAPAAAARSWVV